MRSSISALLGLTALASAFPTHTQPRITGRGFGCATVPSEAFLEVAKEMGSQERKVATKTFVANSTIDIETYFHVVAGSKSLADGYLTDAMLADQFEVMQSIYAPYGITFKLAGTDRTINSNWTVDGDELGMKKELRKGDYKALNIYFQKQLHDDALGYCYFPDSVSKGSDDFYLDACTIQFNTLPGGNYTNFNEGKTVTHEVGHWFGLLHTFQGGDCTSAGDEVADTPAQLSATSGCPVGRDSCPDQAGLDPIHNYMDYSYDSCYEEFTPNQVTRMHNMFNKFRAVGASKRAPLGLDVELREIAAGKLH